MRITPKAALSYITNKFIYARLKKKNITIGKGVKINKKPIIDIHRNANLIIGNNVSINSNNIGYHLNMFSVCKLFADEPGAIIDIGDNTRIHGSCIHAVKKIKIGKNCLIAANCQIIDGNGHDLSFSNTKNRINTIGNFKEVNIEDDVWLGTGVIVLPGVTIGKGSIISANSVVHKDVPARVIAGGNPLQIIKRY
jgi:acetyltransferase-like isoleucine patch superfamily enzyme